MAVFQIESGACTGRGFAAVDANGFLAKLYAWITKLPAAGGPGWTILLDKSALPSAQTITAVDTGAETVTIVGHGYYTGDQVLYTASGVAIGGLSSGQYYYLRKINADNVSFHFSYRYQAEHTPTAVINLSSFPAGTHTLTLRGPHIVISNLAAPANPNTIGKFIKISYHTTESGYIRVQFFKSWDDTNKILRGLYAGYRIATLDAAGFAYDFRGGDECMFFASRISTAWSYTLIDEWTGISGFVEADTVIGTLANAETAGSNVVVELGAGEAALFTLNNYYYLYDYQNKSVVNYVKCVGINLVADTVTIDTLSNDVSAGAIIGAYPHRFCTNGNGSYFDNDIVDDSVYLIQIPYCSGAAGYVQHQYSTVYGGVALNILGGMNITAPNDLGLYSCMRPVITEKYRPNDASSSTGMNRQYGKLKNVFYSYGSMSQMLDYRTINTNDYLKYNSTTPNELILHTESLV